MTVFKEMFFDAVREHLAESFDYDFIDEVLEIDEHRYAAGDTDLEVKYRGVNGEYARLFANTSYSEVIGALL